MACLFLAAGLGAQSASIPFTHLSIGDGLSQATVNCILQDRDGFIWLGTQDGLNRFDGHAFKVYKHDPTGPASLPSNFVLDLAQDPSGDLWIGTQGGGLARWRSASDTFERWQHDPQDPASLPGRSVRAVHLDRTGDLWLATFDAGLARLDRKSGGFDVYRHDPEDPASLSDDRLRTIYQDRAGRLWIGTLGGLDLFDRESRTFTRFRHDPDDPSSLSDPRVFAIHETADGTLWVGTENGLNRRRAGEGGFERFYPAPEDPTSLGHGWVTDLLEDRSGRLWIATDGGLSLWRDGAFERYLHADADPLSLSNDRLLDLYQDRGGVIWIGTQGGGVDRWNPRTWAFAHYRSRPGSGGLSSNAVFAFSESPQGEIFIGTYGGGVDVLDRASGRFRHHRHDPEDPGSLPGNEVTVLHHDRNGALWVGVVGHGASRLDPGSSRFRTFRHDPQDPTSLSDGDVSTFAEDQDGALWLGIFGGGLDRFDPVSETFTHRRHDRDNPESLSSDHLTSLAVAPDGALWIGTFGGGLNRLDRDRDRVKRLQHDPEDPESLASDTVFSLHLDPQGTLWIGTQAGLDKLTSLGEKARFEHYFERDGLPNNSVWGIESDAEGQLWISTNNGLARFDPETKTFKNFDVSHGLQSNEFNLGAHFKSSSGELFFGGVNGFNAFRPEKIEPNLHRPPMALTSFTKLNEPVLLSGLRPGSEPITLGYRDYLFAFEFAALDFTAPEKNRYRYRLEGLDQDWIDLEHRRRVSFTNLDPGRYLLRVQGANNDGRWNEEGLALPIVVTPPPWATWWAYTLYALAALALIVGYLRWQNRRLQREREAAEREREINVRLREVDRMRDEFLANTSHELRTPLYGIGGLAEAILEDPAEDLTPDARSHLSMIVASSQRLNSLVNDILDFAELRRGSLELQRKSVELHALVDVVLTLTRPLAKGKRLELQNAVSPDLPRADADENRVQQILHNLIGNAVKFTEEGAVEVSARRVDGWLEVSVADTGIGVATPEQERIFGAFEQVDASTERRFGGTGLGLAVTRQLVELHGGKIWLRSRPGEGSTFTFTLPVATAVTAAAPEETVQRGTDATPFTQVQEPVAGSRPVEAATPAARTLTAGGRVLVVDDEPINRQVIANHLAGVDLHLVQAADGPQALALIEEQEFDLVLLDIMMPGMSGYEVCRQLRRRFARHELHVMFLTAKTQLADRLAGFAEGANDYLVKPVAREELLARVLAQLELAWVHRHQEELLTRRTEQVKVLSGLLPICAECKKIRDDEGYWSQLEIYIMNHSEAEFSHSFCPTCAEEVMAKWQTESPSESSP